MNYSKINRIARKTLVFFLALTVVASPFFALPQRAEAAAIPQYSGGVLVYTDATAGTPKYKVFDDATGFGAEQSASSVGAVAIEWVNVVASPTADEWIIATRDAGDVLKVQVCTGNSTPGLTCGTPTTVTATAGTHGWKNFDIAYEASSGEAMIVFGTATVDQLAYMTWSGGVWSASSTITTTNTSGTVEWVQLEARPGTNQIGLAWADSNDDVSGRRWDGSAWGAEHTAAITTAASIGDARKIDVSFEGTSGDMLIAATGETAGTIFFGALTAAGVWSLPSGTAADNDSSFIDLQAPNPSDNDIAGVTMGDLAASNPWEGWEYDGAAIVDGTAAVDTAATLWGVSYWMTSVAYVSTTYYAAAVFSDVTGADDINWATMNNAGTWTVQADNLRTRGTMRFLQLVDYPNANKVLLLSSDANSDLWADSWDGAAVGAAVWTDRSGGSTLEGSLSTATTKVFDFAFRLSAPASAPTVTTQTETDVTKTSATVNGTISATGGANATVRGFAWGTNSTLSGGDTATTTENGSFGTGAFTGSLSSLTCGTTYYSRPYATNPTGTGYGTIDSFLTTACPPSISTNAASSITSASATLNGTAINFGAGTQLSEHGFAYGTSSTLTGLNVSTTSLSVLNDTVPFSTVVEGLVCSATYYYRAFGTDDTLFDTGYGSIVSFATSACPPPTVTTQAVTTSGWDISTGSYASKSLSVAGQETDPRGLSFSSDGTKAYAVGLTNDTIYQYTLSPAWDISTGSYASKSLSVAAQDAAPRGLSFSSDGTKAYVVGTTNDTIYQYTLTVAWDISSGSYASKSLSVAGQETTPSGLSFSSDGTKAYVVGPATDTIYQYTLTVAWDISSGSYASKSLSVAGQETNPSGLSFSSDGTKAYIVGFTNGAIYQYTLSTAWDISSGSYASKSLSVTGQESSPLSLSLSSDGTKAYAVGNVNDRIYQYTLSTDSYSLNGNVTATGGSNATVRGFAWGTNSALSGGDTATTTENGSFGTGTFIRIVSSLTCNTTYYARPYATNPSGSGYGTIVSFTTSACPGVAPTVTTQDPSSVAATSFTANGNITATGSSNPTVRGFAYGTNATLATVIATTTENGSFSTGAFTGSITSLTCNTIYYVRAYAVNTAGTSTGSIVSTTTTPCVPTVTTQAESNLTSNSATVNGTITVTGGANATVRGFAWGTNSTLSGGDTATTTENGSFGTGAFTGSLSSLTCGTTYYSRPYATNSAGTGYGTIDSFTTSNCAPTVTTQDESGVSQTIATVNGTISATGGANATVRGFAWGTNSSLSGGDTATTTNNGSFGTGAFNESLSTLVCGTTYYSRPYATNPSGTGYGTIDSFTTSACTPAVVMSSTASDVTKTSATLNGSIIGTGGANATVRGFAWGTNSTLSGGDTATTTENGSFGTGGFTGSLSSLTCNTTYYFRAYATNVAGNGYGAITSFTTSICAPTVTAQAASAIDLNTATFNGTITSTGSSDYRSHATVRGFAFGTNSNLSGGDTATTTQRGLFNAGPFAGATTSATYTITNPVPEDVGDSSKPGFGDFDNDGDYDLIIGTAAAASKGYENTGSNTAPVWAAKIAWNISAGGESETSPAFADLDGDGDLDAMVGNLTGTVKAFDNTGTTASPTWTARVSWDIADIGAETSPALADLDADGDFDLMVGTSTGASTAYKNTGSASSPIWTLESTWNLPAGYGADGAPAFADLDLDGDLDAMVGSSGSVSAKGYRNTGSATSPTWVAHSAWDKNIGQLEVAPAFADLDDDGDMDIIVGGVNGNSQFYRNNATTAWAGLSCGTTYYFRPYATNAGGTGYGATTSFNTTPCSAPTVDTPSSGSITATSAEISAWISATGGSNATVRGFAWGTNATLSGGDTATTTENGSFTFSAFGASLSSLTCNTTYYFRGYATNPTGTGYASIASFITGFCPPTVTTGAATSITATSTVLNGNITNLGGSAYSIARGFAWGTNSSLSGGDTATTTERGVFNSGAFTGATSSPVWTAKAAWDLPDLGSFSAPAFADLDNDGDYDLMMGLETGVALGYENTGTASSPTWTAKSAWDSEDVGSNASPAFFDYDNDGDLDLYLGNLGGNSGAYANVGSASSPSWSALGPSGDLPTVGSYSAPAFADLDNDGDFDAMIGEDAGVVYGYENTGSVTSPSWVAKAAWDTPDIGNTVRPALTDLDNDGDYDLLVGEVMGDSGPIGLVAFKNTGSASSPTWTEQPSWGATFADFNLTPALADLDDNGDLDLLIGEDSGTAKGYENTAITALTGLVCETTYYARAYAVNTAGTSTGSIVSFTTAACGGSPDLQQLHYRWRNDDGTETSATWAAAEDTALTTNVFPGDRRRLRILLTNAGSGSATNYTYRLEHSSSSCTVWQSVPGPSSLANEHWVMDPSQNIQDDFATTDSNGVTNPGGKTFAAGVLKAIGQTTSAHTLTNSQFTELEYSIRSTGNVEVGTTYCFRLTHAGSTTNFTYTLTPQIIVSAVVTRPVGGGGGGNQGGGGESSSGGGAAQGGGNQGGGGGNGGGEGQGEPYPYPTPVGGGGTGGGGGDSGNAMSSSYAAVLKVLSDSIAQTIRLLNRAFLRD